MANVFNNTMNPKAKTELFKIYVKVGEEYELQGRGIQSWTIENNQDFNSNADVLGFIDFERGTDKPTQSVEMSLRKGSKLAELLFDCWFKADYTALDSLDILQKFEFIDAGEEGTDCIAREQKECAIDINSFMGEAENYLKFAVDIHYSNKVTTGKMPKVDGQTITFTPDVA